MNKSRKQILFITPRSCYLALALLTVSFATYATQLTNPNGRLIATGGAMSTEGTAGGGVVPWAVLAGYGDEKQWGGTAWLSNVAPRDFSLNAYGAAAGWDNRWEFSASKQTFDVGVIAPGQSLEQSILGVKVRLFGDLIYTRAPQVSLGVLYKQNDTFDIPQSIGAVDDSGVDIFLAASKLWLDGLFHRSIFLNTTLRATRANQIGLMGFGGDLSDNHQLVGEVSAGLFINRHWVVGAEYRQKPDQLSFAREDDWKDVFVGWFPNKRIAIVAAWVSLGSVAGFDEQNSVYLSVQLSQ